MSNENGHKPAITDEAVRREVERIMRVGLRKRLERPPFVMPKPVKPLPLPEEPASVWDWLAHKYEIVKWGVRLSPYALRTTYGIIMKNWRTTVTAIVGAIALVLNTTGIIELDQEFINGVVIVIVGLIGIFAADANKNG